MLQIGRISYRFKVQEERAVGPSTSYKPGPSAAYNVCTERSREQNEQVYEQHAYESQEGRTQGPQGSGHNGIMVQTGACAFTKSQYDQIVQLLNQTQLNTNTSAGPSVNAAGKAFLVPKILKQWIIDTGSTNHMVSDKDMLSKESIRENTDSKGVQLPNGDVAQITHIGSSSISN